MIDLPKALALALQRAQGWELIAYRGMQILLIENETIKPPAEVFKFAEGGVAFTKFEWATVFKHPEVVRAMINVKMIMPGSGIPDENP